MFIKELLVMKLQKPLTSTQTATAADELIDMEQAIALLKTTRPTFYRWLRAGKIKGMKAGRQWRFYRADVDRFIKGQQPRIELVADIHPLIDALATKLAAVGGKTNGADAGDPVAKVVNLMIQLGVAMRASDFHLESQTDGRVSQLHLRYRVDGVLHTAVTADVRLLPAIIEQWKRLGHCDVNVKDVPQDGRIELDLDASQLDLRVCVIPTVLGENLTARFLRQGEIQRNLDQLPYSPQHRAILRRHLQAPSGIVFCTGPTGSGKTTTLYACLQEVIKPGAKVMSVEDPVEYLLPGMTQMQINLNFGLTFARALRSFLRSDPDVIMIGEMRDLDTLQIAAQAALTGHLVLTTLHTNSAASALTRIMDIGLPPFLVADTVKLVVAQRLVRVLCRDCSVAVEPTTSQLAQAQVLAQQGGLDWTTLPHKFRKPVGCAKCAQTGYRGRTTLTEMLEVTPAVGAALRRGARVEELHALAIKDGMTTICADGIAKAAAGATTLDEVYRYSPMPT